MIGGGDILKNSSYLDAPVPCPRFYTSCWGQGDGGSVFVCETGNVRKHEPPTRMLDVTGAPYAAGDRRTGSMPRVSAVGVKTEGAGLTSRQQEGGSAAAAGVLDVGWFCV